MAAVKTENGLTDKQEKFCQVFVETSNASEAYRQAYNTENMSQEAVWVEASRLQDNPKVALLLKSLRAEHKERHMVTVETIATELEEARLLAMDIQAPSAAVSASMGKAKIYGLITDKNEIKAEIKSVMFIDDVPKD